MGTTTMPKDLAVSASIPAALSVTTVTVKRNSANLAATLTDNKAQPRPPYWAIPRLRALTRACIEAVAML